MEEVKVSKEMILLNFHKQNMLIAGFQMLIYKPTSFSFLFYSYSLSIDFTTL